MNPLVFSLILLGVLLNAGAQLLLKAGFLVLVNLNFSWIISCRLVAISHQLANNARALCLWVSVIVWLAVLSRVDVSIAYPMVSLGYIVTAVAAYYFFTEPLSAMRIGGIFVILMGVYMIARS